MICRREKRGETSSFDREGVSLKPIGGWGLIACRSRSARRRCQTASGKGRVFIESICGPRRERAPGIDMNRTMDVFPAPIASAAARRSCDGDWTARCAKTWIVPAASLGTGFESILRVRCGWWVSARCTLQEFVPDVRARCRIQQDGRQRHNHPMVSRDHFVVEDFARSQTRARMVRSAPAIDEESDDFGVQSVEVGKAWKIGVWPSRPLASMSRAQAGNSRENCHFETHRREKGNVRTRTASDYQATRRARRRLCGGRALVLRFVCLIDPCTLGCRRGWHEEGT